MDNTRSTKPSGAGLSFLSLPVEIRIKVYKLFFSGQPRSIAYPLIRPFSLIGDRHWNLLLVSKRIYKEALPEYYRTCIFGLYELNEFHLQKLLTTLADSHFGRYATNLLVWRIPQPRIFETLREVKWVKLLGITCGVEPDPVSGQTFTYNSLLRALRKASVGFSWDRCQEVCNRYPDVDFMVDFRCDYPELRVLAGGQQQRYWMKINFVYDVRADTFVEDARGTNKSDGLILRPQELGSSSQIRRDTFRAFLP